MREEVIGLVAYGEMCGIAGVVENTSDLDPVGAEARVASMVRAIDHRGPDSNGVRVLEGPRGVRATLGAVRLRIIDVNPSSDQPLSDPTGTVWTVFNGEIYNYRELRDELTKHGHQFRTSSDTECLVHLYRHYDGDAARIATRLRGMFAFAIFDRTTGRIVIARDRLGIKPLYWTLTATGFAFCSEQRPLLRSGLSGSEIDPIALSGYLAKGVVPNRSTIFRDVERLEPGSALTWQNGAFEAVAWWRPDFQPLSNLVTVESAQSEITEAVVDSVQRHLVADRPVGIFLSSGTDSTVIATIAARSGSHRSLNVSFPEEPMVDEGVAAKSTARRLGLAHTEVPVTKSDVASMIPEFLHSLDSPTIDAFNNWLVCRAAKDAGLVVVLSGTGGDELFSGYRTFTQVPRLARLLPIVNALPRTVRQRSATLLRSHRLSRPLARALAGGKGLSVAYHLTRRVFDDDEVAALGLPQPALYSAPPEVRGVDAVTLLELGSYLRDQLLPDADTTSSSQSLELRVPLLDDRVVAAALGLPAAIRSHGKDLLARTAGYEHAMTKQPFAPPMERWLQSSLKPMLRESLLDDDLPLHDLLPSEFRKELYARYLARRVHWSKPWAVAVLRRWLLLNAN